MEKEWEKIKERFEMKQAIRIRLTTLWLGIKPFVEELIAYSFVILLFQIGFLLFIYYFPFSDDDAGRAEKINTINTIRWTLIISISGLFTFHAVTSLIVKILTEEKESYRQIRETYILAKKLLINWLKRR